MLLLVSIALPPSSACTAVDEWSGFNDLLLPALLWSYTVECDAIHTPHTHTEMYVVIHALTLL